MLTPTHLITAQTAYLGACLTAAHPPQLAEALVAVLAGALPDIDHRQGTLGRWVAPLSGWIEHRVGHRTLTHSLLLFALVSLAAWLWLPAGFALAILAGLGSHAFADMMTAQGVCWFWPSRVRCVLPGSPSYRVELMGWGELAFAGVMALAGVGFMALAQQSEGSAGLIRAAIGNISAAREQYDAEKGRNAWTLKVQGRDNRTFATIDGSYPVIGPWQENGFLVRGEAGPLTLCRSATCDGYADHAVLLKGAAQHTTTTTLKRERLRLTELRDWLQPWAGLGELLLIGSARLDAATLPSRPPTLEANGQRLRLHYADAALLNDLPDTLLHDLDLVVQLRHAPGSQPPELKHPEAAPAPARHPALSRWLLGPRAPFDSAQGTSRALPRAEPRGL